MISYWSTLHQHLIFCALKHQPLFFLSLFFTNQPISSTHLARVCNNLNEKAPFTIIERCLTEKAMQCKLDDECFLVLMSTNHMQEKHVDNYIRTLPFAGEISCLPTVFLLYQLGLSSSYSVLILIKVPIYNMLSGTPPKKAIGRITLYKYKQHAEGLCSKNHKRRSKQHTKTQ